MEYVIDIFLAAVIKIEYSLKMWVPGLATTTMNSKETNSIIVVMLKSLI